MLSSNGNILVVHENKSHLSDLHARLSSHFNVFTASDSRSAYRMLQEYDMHVLLTSERLGGMTGMQLIEGISTEFPAVIPLIQASSEHVAVLKQASVVGKIDSYIRTDATYEEIFQLLRSAIKQAELKFENQELSNRLKKVTDENQRTLELFKRYVPEQVVSLSLVHSDSEAIQGETRIVTILFADIRKFTRIAASLKPTEVVNFLNDFWDALGDPVKRNHGSIYKLLGDGMLTVFGAPVSHISNQENAVKCALDMVKSLKKVNEKYQHQFGYEVIIGIGINTGEVVVGNIGTNDHLEYTVIGDAVNIASRIESQTKSNPNEILISENTLDLAGDLFETEESESLVMEGKENPIKLFRVKGLRQSNIKPFRKENSL